MKARDTKVRHDSKDKSKGYYKPTGTLMLPDEVHDMMLEIEGRAIYIANGVPDVLHIAYYKEWDDDDEKKSSGKKPNW